MSKLPRWTAREAEAELLRNGFRFVRSKGSHRIYSKGSVMTIVPFHSGAVINKFVLGRIQKAIQRARDEAEPPRLQ